MFLFVCFSKCMWRDSTMTFLPSLKATYKSVVNFKKKDSTSRRDCFGRFRGLKRNTFQRDGWSFQRTRWGSSREVVWGILVCKGNLHSQKFQLRPLWLEHNFSTEEAPDRDSSNLKSNPPFGKSCLSSLFERGNLEMPGPQNGCLSS